MPNNTLPMKVDRSRLPESMPEIIVDNQVGHSAAVGYEHYTNHTEPVAGKFTITLITPDGTRWPYAQCDVIRDGSIDAYDTKDNPICYSASLARCAQLIEAFMNPLRVLQVPA